MTGSRRSHLIGREGDHALPPIPTPSPRHRDIRRHQRARAEMCRMAKPLGVPSAQRKLLAAARRRAGGRSRSPGPTRPTATDFHDGYPRPAGSSGFRAGPSRSPQSMPTSAPRDPDATPPVDSAARRDVRPVYRRVLDHVPHAQTAIGQVHVVGVVREPIFDDEVLARAAAAGPAGSRPLAAARSRAARSGRILRISRGRSQPSLSLRNGQKCALL